MRTFLRPAFTMIELIMVIVILGIVSSIAAEIIAKVYEGYIIQRAQHRASSKTALVALQIANRLAYAIPGTVVRKNGTDVGGTDINEPGNANDTTLQWVGADADSFKAITSAANRLPGWSGFCDVNATPVGGSTISTPGSNLNLATTIITNLGGNIANAQIYFPLNNYSTDYGGTLLPLVNYGVASGAGTNITLDASLGANDHISEHYKLAWTSYELEAQANGDLVLHYNFTPQRGVAIPNNARKQILLRNVSTFEFRGDGRTIRFKICAKEDIGEDFDITICKEKAVF